MKVTASFIRQALGNLIRNYAIRSEMYKYLSIHSNYEDDRASYDRMAMINDIKREALEDFKNSLGGEE